MSSIMSCYMSCFGCESKTDENAANSTNETELTDLPSSSTPGSQDLVLVQTFGVNPNTTRYLLREKSTGRIWWNSLNRSKADVLKIAPTCLTRRAELNADDFFNAATSTTLRYTGDIADPAVWIKYPMVLDYGDIDTEGRIAAKCKAIQARELKATHKFCTSPHPNICKFLGVVTDVKDRVIGSVYTRYTTDLFDLVVNTDFLTELAAPPKRDEPPRLLTVASIMAGIRSGVDFIHSLGLVHCDVRPENVFLDVEKGDVVIGDFDGVCRPGSEDPGRWAPKKWWPDGWKGNPRDKKFDLGTVQKTEEWLEAWLQRKLGGS